MVVNDGRLLTGGVWGAILGVVIGYLLSTVLKRVARTVDFPVPDIPVTKIRVTSSG